MSNVTYIALSPSDLDNTIAKAVDKALDKFINLKDEETIYNVAQASTYLGKSKTTILRWCREKKIKADMPGTTYMIRLSELKKLI